MLLVLLILDILQYSLNYALLSMHVNEGTIVIMVGLSKSPLFLLSFMLVL